MKGQVLLHSIILSLHSYLILNVAESVWHRSTGLVPTFTGKEPAWWFLMHSVTASLTARRNWCDWESGQLLQWLPAPLLACMAVETQQESHQDCKLSWKRFCVNSTQIQVKWYELYFLLKHMGHYKFTEFWWKVYWSWEGEKWCLEPSPNLGNTSSHHWRNPNMVWLTLMIPVTWETCRINDSNFF